jgi:pimeloyl-ACP methyl ester carboxylesterase
MHGIPSSRLAAGLVHEVAHRCNVRLLAPDRPGYGASDPRAGRTILDCPEDIAALADALGLETFGLVGVSGALPYVLACTVAIPERLTQVAILSGLAPLNAPGVLEGANPGSIAIYQLAMRSPRLAGVWMKMLAGTARRSPGVVYNRQLSYLPAADRELFDAEGMRERRIADLAEAFRQGTAAASAEAVLHVTDWGFAFADVPVEVLLWQGTKDRLHPLGMGRYLEQSLPRCRAIYAEGAGAFGFINQMDVIFGTMFGFSLEQVPAGGLSNG